jgi:hypothetical protein
MAFPCGRRRFCRAGKKTRGKPGGLPLYYGLQVAGTTRLELATSGVTGRRSNQLNYAPVFQFKVESSRFQVACLKARVFLF